MNDASGLHGIAALVCFLFFGFFAACMGMIIQNAAWSESDKLFRNRAIKAGVGYYHPETAEFMFKGEQNVEDVR